MSNTPNKEDIKKALINVFSKTTEKAVHDAAYDRTVLATIQSCIDASIGAYKIKYQDGYFTAYSVDKTFTYTPGTIVYVKITKNDLSNRLDITGSVSSSSSDKISTTYLEGDQEYQKTSEELFTIQQGKLNDFNMSSYDGVKDTFYKKIFYKYDPTTKETSIENIVLDQAKIRKYMVDCGNTVIRFGATFQTKIVEARKTGDYGIGIIIQVQDSNNPSILKDIDCRITSFDMAGNPLEFTIPVQQYQYFNVNNFVCIKEVYGYVTAFPDFTTRPEDDKDILISNLSLYSAEKLYDTKQNKYALNIEAIQGRIFENPNLPNETLQFKATLLVDGNPVSDLQKLEYHWAQRNLTVKSVNDLRYNSLYKETGWACLDNWTIKEFQDGKQPAAANWTKVITQLTSENVTDKTKTTVKSLEWAPTNPLILSKKRCRGRVTTIRCLVVYNGVTVYQDIDVINPEGAYVLISTKGNQTKYYGGASTTSVLAGVFKDVEGATAPVYQSTGYKYYWKITDESGLSSDYPSVDPNLFLNHNNDYNSKIEEEKLKEGKDVRDAWLRENDGFELCYERYSYYVNKKNDESIAIAEEIIEKKKVENASLFKSTTLSTGNYYLLGPCTPTATYQADTKDYSTAKITDYAIIENQYNTLTNNGLNNIIYNFSVGKIGVNSTYEVSVIDTSADGDGAVIGTQKVTLINDPAAATNFKLEIINGTQSFLYDESGIAPTSAKYNGAAMLLQPLYFRLYNKDGTLLYDSQNPDSKDNQTTLTSLKPIWTFAKGSTLLTTNYADTDSNVSKHNDTASVFYYDLKNSNNFIYGLKEQFNSDYIQGSNITLQVTASAEDVVIGTTNFTFFKEGNLNTNGTKTIMQIEDPIYNQFRDAKKYYDIEDSLDAHTFLKKYSYTERHLQNLYMYATKGNKTKLINSDKVNLKFARGFSTSNNPTAISDDKTVAGGTSATLYGYWYRNGSVSAASANATWSFAVPNVTEYKGQEVNISPPFSLGGIGSKTAKGPSVNVLLNTDTNAMVTTPLKLDETGVNRATGNIIKVKDSQTESYEKADGTTGTLIHYNYGYYGIPYFAYRSSIQTATNNDPTQHIIITGGYDNIEYDVNGANPTYRKGYPFRVYLFDDIGTNITSQLVSNGTITWYASPGLNISNTSISAPDFNSTYRKPTVIKYGVYTTYKNKNYKCIKEHNSNNPVTEKDKDGIATAWGNPVFSSANWEDCTATVLPINKGQYKTITPAPNYQSIAQEDLFNSWIAVYVTVTVNNIEYEAEALLPINIYCNIYGSEEINGWDGKSLVLDEDNAYMIANKVAAGVKNDNNAFTGITIGETFYPDGTGKKNEIGLFGYGTYNKENKNATIEKAHGRTIFMDAETGRTLLGPSGSTQIVLDPDCDAWSKLSGWYFNKDYLYKPIGTKDDSYAFTDLAQGTKIKPPTSTSGLSAMHGSVGIHAPEKVIEDPENTVFLWASHYDGQDNDTLVDYNNWKKGKWWVNYAGQMYAKDATIEGTVRAIYGIIGDRVNSPIYINTTREETLKTDKGKDSTTFRANVHYQEYWKGDSGAFYIRDNITPIGDYTEEQKEELLRNYPKSAVVVKGRVLMESGQIGSDDELASPETNAENIFFVRKWYPWKYPTDSENYNSNTLYYDSSQELIEYPIVHKNFSIDKSGNVTLKGTIFADGGSRIGNWIIKDNSIVSAGSHKDEIRLDSGAGKITAGAIYINGNGNMGASSNSIDGWWIHSDGTASFSGKTTFKEAVNAEGGFDSDLWIHTGHALYFGDNKEGQVQVAPNGGMSFVQGGLIFHAGEDDFKINSKTVTLDGGINLKNGSGNLEVNGHDIITSNRGNLSISGNATIDSNLEVKGALGNHLKELISNVLKDNWPAIRTELLNHLSVGVKHEEGKNPVAWLKYTS